MQHGHGEIELVLVVMPAGREGHDDERRRDDTDERDDEQHHAEGAGDRVHELTHFVVAALVLVLADDRHEGLRERAFGEQPAQEVRDLEGHQPGVHEGAGAERRRIDHFPGEARDAGDQRGKTGDRGALEYRPAHPATPEK